MGIIFSLFICLTSPSCFFNLLGTSIIKQSFGELVLSEGKGKQEKLMLKLSWTKYGSSSWEKISTSFWYFLEVVFFSSFFFFLCPLCIFLPLYPLKKGKYKKKIKACKRCKRIQICSVFFLERYKVAHLQSF